MTAPTPEPTPTTDEVRDYHAHGQFADPRMSEHDHARAFDRWLAAHDAQVRAEAVKAVWPHAGVVHEVEDIAFMSGAEDPDATRLVIDVPPTGEIRVGSLVWLTQEMPPMPETEGAF